MKSVYSVGSYAVDLSISAARLGLAFWGMALNLIRPRRDRYVVNYEPGPPSVPAKLYVVSDGVDYPESKSA